MGSALAALAKAGCAGTVIIVDDGEVFPVRQTLVNCLTSALLIAVNPGPKGPSAARNHGAAQAQAELLFFLDDDDLMEPDYIQRILAQRRSGSCQTTWGFSRIRDSRAYSGLPTHAAMLRPDVPLQQRLAGIGTGFWVEHTVFQKLGGLDVNLRINEDTDFCLALASAGLMPWYDPEPGVKLDAARLSAGGIDRPSTTKSARAAERAAAWQHILKKNEALLELHPRERAIFAARIAKFRARAGDLSGAVTFALAQPRTARWRALFSALIGGATRRK